jgi:GNAT superfamily N-acetyltransferase
MAFSTRELSLRTLPDFEKLAMKQGGCWCMYYQRPKPVGRELSLAERARNNRREKETLVRQGCSHAILVYEGQTPVGWCQYGTDEELPRIDAGRNYRKVGRPVGVARLWRITCFFVDRKYRSRGVAKIALRAALESISKQGGGIVEAYPVVSKKMAAIPEWRWFGTPSMFRRERFRTVAPLGTSGVLMRKVIRPQPVGAPGRPKVSVRLARNGQALQSHI